MTKRIWSAGLLAAMCLQAANEPLLYFTIGMHIEPLGTTAQGFSSGQASYQTAPLFDRHVQDIETVVRIVERHGGRMTIQAQSPFTSVAISRQNPVLANLARRGHEIALHFHEDAHLGRNSGTLGVETWTRVMKEEIELIKQAASVSSIRYWSGGNLYPDLYKAAAAAGLSVNSDWKNPTMQSTPLELVGVNPWRPAGGTNGVDFSLFIRHDPRGPMVFLPEGQYDRTDFAASRRSEDSGGDAAYFEYLKRVLEASVAASKPDRVNVFHFTIHPGEFRGDPGNPFGVIENYLTQAVDPLVKAGKVRWATFSEMADAYIGWERAHPGVDPRASGSSGSSTGSGSGTGLGSGTGSNSGAGTQTNTSQAARGYITFAINVHDWTHPEESARTLSRLVDLFERYQARGDFYFTPEIARALSERFPELIERFRRSRMTISYHLRPPHPLYTGFDQRLLQLDDATLERTLIDYETYALDLGTGNLDRSKPGGFQLISALFGRPPVVASVPNDNPRLRDVGQRLYSYLGARMTVVYHETGTKIEQPFETVNGLLIRPSDFSITRVQMPSGQENFWWNLVGRQGGEQYRPIRLLERGLADWEERAPGRAPFITALIHDNNFARSGPEGWTSIYFTIVNNQRGQPLPAPWDLSAPDPSQPRSEAEQEAIWAAYEEVLAWASRNLRVVTSEDIVAMSQSAQPAATPSEEFNPAKAGTTETNIHYCTAGEEQLLLDAYYPSQVNGRWPAVVFIHGGGWTAGDKRETLPDLAALREAGFLVLSINYRLGPQHKFPAMIEDAKCAVRFLRARAAAFNLNPDRIGVMGSSAGGHLSSLVGVAGAEAGFDTGDYLSFSSRVQAVASLWAPSDLTVPFPGGYDSRREVFAPFDPALASPVSYVSADDPPFLLVHGEEDPLVPISQAERMLERLRQAGVPAELLRVANAGHSLVPVNGLTPSPLRSEVRNRIVDFFRTRLQK